LKGSNYQHVFSCPSGKKEREEEGDGFVAGCPPLQGKRKKKVPKLVSAPTTRGQRRPVLFRPHSWGGEKRKGKTDRDS